MTPQTLLAVAASRRRRPLWAVAAGILVHSLAPRAGAQAPTTAPADVQFTVTKASVRGPLISVPKDQGVLVDFTVPLREVRVANAEIADVDVTAPQQLLLTGKTCGTTQLLAVVDGGQQRVFTVVVDPDLERLQASIRATVPRAKVEAQALLDSVVLTGTVPDLESADRILQVTGIYSGKIVNHMRVAGTQQVLLRVTVAEVNRTATRQLGFNGWLAGDNVRDMFTLSNIGQINPSNIGAVGGALANQRIPFAVNEDGIPVGPAPTLSFGFPRVQMQVFIQALRENGLLNVLAEPNLVTLSGQEATFLAGGEFPIPVAQRDSVTVEFREFGVRLHFTPTVLSDNAIRLKVAPEVSEPDYSSAVQIAGYSVPGLIQRRVETVVELGPGQTFAIGGLLSERTRATSQKIPALGDIPVLGSLFSSVRYQSSETELVILVTPEMVAALDPGQVAAVPGGRHVPPNDWELFALGQLEGQPRPAAPAGPAAPASADGAGSTMTLRLRGPVGPAGADEGV